MKESKQPLHDNCFMCSRVLKEWLPALSFQRQTIKIKKGRLVFKEGDKVNGIYFVVHGVVKVHKTWGNKELILRFAKAGTVLGHRGLSTFNETYPISATALEDVIVCYVSLNVFETTLKMNQQFAYDLFMFFADELRLSEEKMLDINLKSVKSRLAKAILLLRINFGEDEEGYLSFTINKNDLAAYAGTTYETSFRVMNELIAEGVIGVKGKSIKILDTQALEYRAKEELL